MNVGPDMLNEHRGSSRHRMPRVVVALVGLAALLAACKPGTVTTFVGTSDGSGTVPGATSPDPAGTSLDQPSAVVAIPGGGAYVYDRGRCQIYEVHSTVSLFAGTGTCGDTGDGGPALSAEISEPYLGLGGGLAIGPDGSLYVNQDGTSIRRIQPDGSISTIPVPVHAGADGFGNGGIVGFVVEDDGTIVYLDGNGTAQGGTIRSYATDGTAEDLIDLPATSQWYGLAQTGADTFATGNLGVSDNGIYRVDVTAQTLTLVPGSGLAPGHYGLVAAADGTVYALGADGSGVYRVGLDDTTAQIASITTGVTNGLALTPNNSLLVSTGHVVVARRGPSRGSRPACGLSEALSRCRWAAGRSRSAGAATGDGAGLAGEPDVVVGPEAVVVAGVSGQTLATGVGAVEPPGSTLTDTWMAPGVATTVSWALPGCDVTTPPVTLTW